MNTLVHDLSTGETFQINADTDHALVTVFMHQVVFKNKRNQINKQTVDEQYRTHYAKAIITSREKRDSKIVPVRKLWRYAVFVADQKSKPVAKLVVPHPQNVGPHRHSKQQAANL